MLRRKQTKDFEEQELRAGLWRCIEIAHISKDEKFFADICKLYILVKDIIPIAPFCKMVEKTIYCSFEDSKEEEALDIINTEFALSCTDFWLKDKERFIESTHDYYIQHLLEGYYEKYKKMPGNVERVEE